MNLIFIFEKKGMWLVIGEGTPVRRNATGVDIIFRRLETVQRVSLLSMPL